jgi:hypothetical protein
MKGDPQYKNGPPYSFTFSVLIHVIYVQISPLLSFQPHSAESKVVDEGRQIVIVTINRSSCIHSIVATCNNYSKQVVVEIIYLSN